jgi:kumamolisin
MARNQEMRPVSGSERIQLANATIVGRPDPEKLITLTVYVRPGKTNVYTPSLHEAVHSSHAWKQACAAENTLSAFEADRKDLLAVEKFAAANKLKVLESSRSKRSVLIQGKIADASRAFGVELHIFEHPGGHYRGRTGPVCVPASLDDIVEAVFGFDNRPMGRPYVQQSTRRFISRAAQPYTYLPPQVADFYSFPKGTDGSGQTIVIMTFNGALGDSGQQALGGYNPALLKPYFKNTLKLTPPSITDVVIHGPGNTPGDGKNPNDATDEVLLDICMVAGVAPKANLVMYFTEFTEQGWVDAITAAVTATQNKPDVISISYGNPEDGPAGEILWTKQAIRKVSEAFKRAALAGITICCASGDAGSTEGLSDHRQHVDFPASSPWVLSCGGTRVMASNSVISQESVWNDGPGSAGGGGISNLFAIPAYQTHANIPPSANPSRHLGRGVPDVASLADPETGVIVVMPDGSEQPIGGTSAAAPLWAALIARLNQALGKPVGFLNPPLYKNMSSGVLRDIIDGDNGAYRAGTGWDACTGFGSPNGSRLQEALKNAV